MRVLLIVHGFPPAAAGGTEIYVHDYARALAAIPGVEVMVLAREGDPNRPEYSVRSSRTGDGLTVLRVNNTFQACTSFEDSYANPSLAAVAAPFIDDFDPDVVHVQHLTCLSTRLLDRGRARRPVVMTLNDYWLFCHRGQLLRPDGTRCEGAFERGCSGCIPAGVLTGPSAYRAGRVARALPLPGAAPAVRTAVKLMELAAPAERTRQASLARLVHLRRATAEIDLFLAPSATMASWALRFGIDRSRVLRSDQGIDLRPFAAVARRPSDRLRLVFAGALIPSKAPHILLEAAASLREDRIWVDLLGASAAYHGDESYARRLAPLLGSSFVRRLGPVPHERIPDAFADADLLVVPSVWVENAPFVIREAFAAGLPVIASDLGGMAEMVRHGRDGLLFAAGDPASLAGQIEQVLDRPDLLERLRQGVRPPMSIEQDAAAGVRMYERISRARGPRRRRESRPRAPFSQPPSSVQAIVLNYRTPEQTALAVRSIDTSTHAAATIVVDNASDDGSVARLTPRLAGARIIANSANAGFSGGCNVGIRAALEDGAAYVLLLNSDAVLAPHAIEGLLAAARAHPDVGIFAPVILSREEPDRIASAGIRYSPSTGRMRHLAAGQPISLLAPGTLHAVDAVSGCAMFVRRDVFENVGLLDEAFFFYFEDVEFCLRARRAGFGIACVPGAIAYHEGGRSIGRRSTGRVYFAARNHLRLARMAAGDAPTRWLRGGLIVGLNAGYVLLSGETPRIRGLAALARGVWHHLGGRYGPS